MSKMPRTRFALLFTPVPSELFRKLRSRIRTEAVGRAPIDT
jgi:hypothetical protein